MAESSDKLMREAFQDAEKVTLSMPRPESPTLSASKHLTGPPKPNIEWVIAFIAHRTNSINDSYFYYFDPEKNLAQSHKDLTMDPESEFTVVTCAGNPKNTNIMDLLNGFCQSIELPYRVPPENFLDIGAFVSKLFEQHQGIKFKNEDLPYGIRGVQQVDPAKQLRLIRTKTGGNQVPMFNYVDLVQVHVDEGMLERGLINYSIFGKGIENLFSFMVIVNITNDQYKEKYGTYPCNTFNVLLITSCFIFHHALAYINDPANSTEAAILARQIGQNIFEESTRVLLGNRGTSSPSLSLPPKEEKKKKQKKRRKPKKGKNAGGEKVEGPAQGAEAEPPKIEVQPPTPVLESLETSSPASPSRSHLSPASASRSPPPEVFNFLRRDRRLICRFESCTILANASYPSSVCCPRCTTYSYTRYCSLAHLLGDVREHFASTECGSTLIHEAVDDSDPATFPGCRAPIRPYVQELRGWGSAEGHTKNLIERHRQALYRSMHPDVAVDYHVFDDIDRLAIPRDDLRGMPVDVQKRHVQRVRGTGRVCATVRLSFADARKAQFNEVIDACLRVGSAAGTVMNRECCFLIEVVKDELERQGLWDVDMEEKVAMQMGFEFGFRMPVEMRMV